jgi:hypothetical protein
MSFSSRCFRGTDSGSARTTASSAMSLVNRDFRASCALLNPPKNHRP